MAEHNEGVNGYGKEPGEAETELIQGTFETDNTEVTESNFEIGDKDALEAELEPEYEDSYIGSTVSGGNVSAPPYTDSTVSGNDAAVLSDTENLAGREAAEIVSLQIPERVRIIVDPFEIDGNGQIYSEQYVVRNVGITAGILTLSNAIRISGEGEEDEATVRTETEEMHCSWEKSIYLEMAFGNGDKVVFTQEGSVYEVELEAGEELALWFAGEVNENASQPWRTGDIEVMIGYTWDTKEKDIAAGSSEVSGVVLDNGEQGEDEEPSAGDGADGGTTGQDLNKGS